MSVRDRIKRYRESGGGADWIRVEVLVPADARSEVLAHAASLRKNFRERDDQLQRYVDLAVAQYGIRVLDNIDLARLGSAEERARVIGRALMARGDAKAFVLGRQLVDAAD